MLNHSYVSGTDQPSRDRVSNVLMISKGNLSGSSIARIRGGGLTCAELGGSRGESENSLVRLCLNEP